MNEFDLIKQYFSSQSIHRSDVVQGIGDDTAIVNIPQDHELAITTDTLIAGVHFPMETDPYDIGYKSLAVNLSDLAAMGASPAWVTLALTLPSAATDWLAAFCKGFYSLAYPLQIQLIGGDMTRGLLSVTVQAMGLVPLHQGLLRSTAKPQDLIYVTGTLGDAGLALQFLQDKIAVEKHHQDFILERLNRPEPRISCGIALRKIAHAAIDISDGLIADLSHILTASQVGAMLDVDKLPLSNALLAATSKRSAITLALTSGDDYELCFTVPLEKQAELETTLFKQAIFYTCIGTITEQQGLQLRDQKGNIYHEAIQGYQHFK